MSEEQPLKFRGQISEEGSGRWQGLTNLSKRIVPRQPFLKTMRADGTGLARISCNS